MESIEDAKFNAEKKSSGIIIDIEIKNIKKTIKVAMPMEVPVVN